MKHDGDFVESLRRAFASTADVVKTAESCPSPERIWNAAHGELSHETTREAVRHLRACPSCAAEWRTAMEPAEEGEARGVPMPRRWSPLSTTWIPLVAAAALVLGVGTAFLIRQTNVTPEPSTFRTSSDLEIRSLIPEDPGLPRDRFLLRWSALEEGTAYTVKVDRRDLTPVTSARNLAEPRYLVPAEKLVGITSGEMIVWRVEAHLLDGRRVSSPAFVVRLE